MLNKAEDTRNKSTTNETEPLKEILVNPEWEEALIKFPFISKKKGRSLYLLASKKLKKVWKQNQEINSFQIKKRKLNDYLVDYEESESKEDKSFLI